MLNFFFEKKILNNIFKILYSLKKIKKLTISIFNNFTSSIKNLSNKKKILKKIMTKVNRLILIIKSQLLQLN